MSGRVRVAFRGWRLFIAGVCAIPWAGAGQGAGQGVPQVEADAVTAAIAAAGAKWTAGVTSISKLTAAEKLLRCGTVLRVPAPEERVSLPVDFVPPAFDWRQRDGADWTSPIKDQDGCGSCWDFSAIGVFEALLNIGTGNPTYDVDLSEQYVLSCCSYCGDCQDGGWPSMALEFCRTSGTVTEACLPYGADDGIPCDDACSEDSPQQIGDWRYLPADVDQIKQAIYTYGPVCACFVVYEDLAYYTSGVYEHVVGDALGGHAIVIVGWDDAREAWICKNSWGTDWGETIDGQPYTFGAGDGGWFRIRWGSCNIESYETVAATLTSFPAGQVVVTVLDEAGAGIEGAEVYVNCGEWTGATDANGIITFSLPASFKYDVVACSGTAHVLLSGAVSSPGALTLDCRTASSISVTAYDVNSSPLEAGLYFECGSAELLCPLWTDDGSGVFWITPGVYDFQVWRWPYGGAEGYNLAMLGVDLGASGTLVIDASDMPTARVSLSALPDFSALYHYGWCCGFEWAPIFDLAAGDAIYSADDWSITHRLVREVSSTVSWSYYDDMWISLEPNEGLELSAGGTLSLSTTPDSSSYGPAQTVSALTTLADGFANDYNWVEMYDSEGEPSAAFSPGHGPLAERLDAPRESSTGYLPWLTITPPTAPPIFDAQTSLGRREEVSLASDAEAGTYALHATQVTHQGTLEADSSFEVVPPAPDPYEPNDTCETAYSIGAIPPSFMSQTAHAIDPNSDWYSLEVTQAGLLVIETTCVGDNADTVIWFYDTCGGTLLATDDDSGPGLGSRVGCRVAPGTYKLLLEQFGNGYGSGTEYTFTVELQPAPDIRVTGGDPMVLEICEGQTRDFSSLLSVESSGDPGSVLSFRIVEHDITQPAAPAPGATSGAAAGRLPGVGDKRTPLPPKAIEPGPGWTLLWDDPDEATSGPGDIACVYAQISDGVLYFRVTSHEQWDSEFDGLATYIWLDVDQNASTGFTSADGWYMDGMGADYVIWIGLGYAELYRWRAEEWEYLGVPEYLSLYPNADLFTVGVAIANLTLPQLPPGISGGLDLVSSNGWGDDVDWAPDEGLGHLAYPSSLSFLSCVPDNATLSAGSSAAITLHVNADSFACGTTRQVRLYFMSNAPDELATRAVTINVLDSSAAAFRVDSSGTVSADGSFYGSDFVSGSADVAEWVPVSAPVEVGDVLMLDAANPGYYCKSMQVCGSLVAGVVSQSPGVSLGTAETGAARALLALVGIVPVKVTWEGGAIAPGDLLVASSTPGYAMRWNESLGLNCALVGKALESMDGETGIVLVLLVR